MTDPHIHARVEDLEVRMAFLARTVEDLDGVVRQVAEQVATLRAEMDALRAELGRHVERSADLAEEVPPHW